MSKSHLPQESRSGAISQIFNSTPKTVAVNMGDHKPQRTTADWQGLGDWKENGHGPNRTAWRLFPLNPTLGMLQRGCGGQGNSGSCCLWVDEAQDLTCANLCLQATPGGSSGDPDLMATSGQSPGAPVFCSILSSRVCLKQRD